MNRTDLYRSFLELDDDVLERSEATPCSGVVLSGHRRLAVVLIAAVLAVAVMGAGVAAVVYGDNIQNWFAHNWKTTTGQKQSEEQTVLIDRLSSEVGLSETVNGITVTVDSATVGDDSFYLLLRVTGMEFSEKNVYNFANFHVKATPAPPGLEHGVSSSLAPCGIDGDRAALFLITYDRAPEEDYDYDTYPLEVELTLVDFVENQFSNKRKLLAEGEWNFAFALEWNRVEVKRLPDGEIRVRELDTNAEIPVLLTDLELTNTGLRFRYPFEEGTPLLPHTCAVFADGQTIGIRNGSERKMEDGVTFDCDYEWKIPIDLNDVTAIRFGDVDIPVQ